MTRRTQQCGEAGFTMIELLTVMAISLFSLAGLMSVYTSASRANQSVDYSTQAIGVAEQTMETFRSMTISEVESVAVYGAITTAGWGPIEHPDGNVLGRNGVIFARNVRAIETQVSPGLVRIGVEVLWVKDGTDPRTANSEEQHRVTLEMLRTRKEAL